MINQLCVRCNQERPVEDFLNGSSTYRRPTCSNCRKIADAKRRSKPDYKEKHAKYTNTWEDRNPGQKTAYMRELRARSPEFREKQRLVSNAYNAKHREERLAYQKARQVERQTFINSFKDSPCKDCGLKFPTFCMDFDHVRGEKKDNIANMKSNRTLDRIKEEIDKCDLVCAICHRIRTQSRLSNCQHTV